GKEIFKCVYESEELLNVGFRSGNGYDSSASSDVSSDEGGDDNDKIVKKIFRKFFKKVPKRKKSSTSINSIKSNSSNKSSNCSTYSNNSNDGDGKFSSKYSSNTSYNSSGSSRSTQQKYVSHKLALHKSTRLNKHIPENVSDFTLQYNFEIRTSLEEHVRQLHHGENTNENKIVLEEYQDLNKLSGTDSIWMFLFDFEEKMSMEKIVNIARGTDSNEVEENIAEEKVSTDDALESVGKVLNFIQQNYLSVDSQLFRNLHTK
ncbi:389_t:CDS:2, partial [Entrophospora sp. SA101]